MKKKLVAMRDLRPGMMLRTSFPWSYVVDPGTGWSHTGREYVSGTVLIISVTASRRKADKADWSSSPDRTEKLLVVAAITGEGQNFEKSFKVGEVIHLRSQPFPHDHEVDYGATVVGYLI